VALVKLVAIALPGSVPVAFAAAAAPGTRVLAALGGFVAGTLVAAATRVIVSEQKLDGFRRNLAAWAAAWALAIVLYLARS
jgi:hypothetical protein